jgi:hypothetical protein
MAIRKKTRRKKLKSYFTLSNSAEKRQSKDTDSKAFKRIFKAVSIICVLAAAVVLLFLSERYLKSVRPIETGPLVLLNMPKWVSAELKTRIITAAGGDRFKLNEQTAHLVAQNLKSITWLDDVEVQITHNNVSVNAHWRKPLALITKNFESYYIDTELVVLNYIDLPELPVVRIKGAFLSTIPQPGKKLQQDEDLAAAIAVLTLLDRMDRDLVPDRPLLGEIESIDVSNFKGRENSSSPHIVLYAKDQTQIIWGAEIGAWARHLEAKDEEKLAKLYTYYEQNGTLMGGARYINLRDPHDKVPMPTDRF